MGNLKLHFLSAIQGSSNVVKKYLETNSYIFISGTSNNFQTAIQFLNSEQTDILIIDDAFFKKSEIISFINILPGCLGNGKSIIYTSSKDPHYFKNLIENGICGIFHKKSPVEKISEAIKLVNIGSVYIDAHVNFSIFRNDFIQELQEDIITGPLSKREKEILVLISLGLKNKQIAKKLSLSVKTIGNYKEKIKDKLGVSTVKELYNLKI
ncbi:MAG: response regulator transcription factor [Ignavibacteriaceae bacterium]